ncbi:helix-turn-helix domain-containing protein [Permianibacter sp. IMCC34836]|uniref:GlxA family transcriptional regulator n=1 Tax=Permianibacter fluminis TaxID=2738515 RepID=UPI001552B8CB|nr:helix-turn-helix domain-containing protein [Permianibacter fluminis]NQD35939.1 helix-turn-helix domain-containing protein [Permianibacter fluminis]
MNIAVLALEGVFDTGISTVLDVFHSANELNQLTQLQAPALTVQVVGLRPTVQSALGWQIPVQPVPAATPDWVVVPAIGYKLPEALVPALARADVIDAGAQLRQWAGQGASIAAACIGTFVLAESGLLNQHQATTTWWLAPLFRQRYPEVQLNAEQMIVADRNCVTAGAALSHVDLAFWLLRQHSPALASLVAKYLVVDSRPAQSAYVISDHLARANPLVEQFDRWARAHLAQPFNLDAAAAALATSKRTLARRLNAVLGKSPVAYLQDLRIERAVHLLKTSQYSVDQIAEQVGYADGVTLRTLMRRRLGLGIKELRRA